MKFTTEHQRSAAVKPRPRRYYTWETFARRLAPPDVRGCREWTGKRARNGYGHVGWRRLSMGAHRLAWILTHGPIPDGLWVLHHCDNPPCCEPTHLFLGTAADNSADCEAKGRHPHKGVNNGRTFSAETRARVGAASRAAWARRRTALPRNAA